ncbi:MAG TPA: flagellar basal body-associated FliL family protein [Polyangiales bacterium]|nr:flagellar basal body-associated FliL family protein [Polyangiales bacterium]
MSEPTPEAAPPADAAAAAPKASKLPIILAAVNFIAILGLGGYFVYTQQHAAAQGKSDRADEKKEEGGEHGEKKEGGHGEEAAEEEPAEEAAEGHGEKKAEGHGEKKAEGHGEKAGHGGGASEGEAAPGGPLLALESMVTNMAEPDSDRYLKVSMQLRLTSEAARPEVEAQLVPVRNQILLYLSSLTVSDTSGADNKYLIQKKVKRIANEAMPSSRVTQVYFTEFVIQ